MVGKAKESETQKEYSEIWEKEEIFFAESGILTQRIKIVDPTIPSITLEIYGQVCKQACIQVAASFSFSLDGKKLNKELILLSDKSKSLTKKLKLDLKNTAIQLAFTL